jgi:hypothetical protein
MHLAANMNPHVFGIGHSDPKKLSGFHSVAVLKKKLKAREEKGPLGSSSELLPVVHTETTPHLHSKCYTCTWNFTGGASAFTKFSSMYPKDYTEEQVLNAIRDAVKYWENPPRGGGGTTTGRKEIMKKLVEKFGLHWAGQCLINGYTVVIGGFCDGDVVNTAFPLQGVNGNF